MDFSHSKQFDAGIKEIDLSMHSSSTYAEYSTETVNDEIGTEMTEQKVSKSKDEPILYSHFWTFRTTSFFGAKFK